MTRYTDDKGRKAMNDFIEAHVNEELVEAFEKVTARIEIVNGRAVVSVIGGTDPRTVGTDGEDLFCRVFDLAEVISQECLENGNEVLAAVAQSITEARQRQDT